MFKHVSTMEEGKIFKDIWEHTINKNHWLDAPYRKESIRYLIYDRKYKKPIGTVEFTPASIIPIETLSKRYRTDNIQIETLWEVDRLSLLRDYQRKGKMTYIFIRYSVNTIKHTFRKAISA
ncbi:hypothetical protein [Jeotgalibacillus aurantiacus]|uniref:hypothetical protein n=1 Tax=Jeotgalibacillus aurantiacus TaxID=2763266 RepID=UPI001D0A7C6D|nr:hypothetical protein [Jeotgalibacillus aurantiacus]